MQQINQDETFDINMSLDEVCSYNYAFEKIFLEAVDSTFSMLGDKAKVAMFNYLEKKLGAERETIGRNPEAFEQAIQAIFGQATLIIEMQIIRALHSSKPNFKFKWSDTAFTFMDYIDALRSKV